MKEHVTLHYVRGELERRPVDRTLSAGTDHFRERTIEPTEKAEEAIVIKEARVKENVVVCKEAEERTQPVSDTARRIELKADDQRGGAGTCTTSTEMRRKSAVGSSGMGPTKTKVDKRH